MNKLKYALFGITLLVVSWAASFTVVALLYNPDASAQSGSSLVGERDFWILSSTEEAKEVAGHDLAAPDFLPDGFVSGEKITVSEAPREKELRVVERTWKYSENPRIGIYLLQGRDPFTLGGAEPASINDFSGERQLLTAELPHRPYPELNLRWREDGFSYLLIGSIGGPLTEEIILQIAASLRLS